MLDAMTANLCASTALHGDRRLSSNSPPPACVSSSGSSDTSDKETPCDVASFPHGKLRAGESSPSEVCDRRKLSAAIASTLHSRHPVLGGRQAFLAPSQDGVAASTPSTPKGHREGMLVAPRSAPPKPHRTAPPRASGKKDRRSSHGKQVQTRSIAPLPSADHLELHRAADGEFEYVQFRTEPSPLREEAWSEPLAGNFQVRSRNYMADRKKIPSQSSAFRLMVVDLVNSPSPVYGGICAHPSDRVQMALKREKETGVRQLPPFVFCVNLCVPGPPFYHKVSYFAIDDMKEIEAQSTPFGRLMHKFIFGESDEFRNNTFKLIPRVVDGNFVVRKAVGSRPSILGKKIKQHYVRGERYFEVIVDISSDAVAQRIVKLALGYTKTLVVDMMFLLEGESEGTLPERIFGGVRMKHIDFRDKDGKRTLS